MIMAIGPLSHSRWLTTANRLMDLWTRSHGLTGQHLENLKHICLFIITVYYQQWFHIKKDHKLEDGPRHVLSLIQLVSKNCSAGVRAVVDRYISRTSCVCWVF